MCLSLRKQVIYLQLNVWKKTTEFCFHINTTEVPANFFLINKTLKKSDLLVSLIT